jgi:glutamine synthetase
VVELAHLEGLSAASAVVASAREPQSHESVRFCRQEPAKRPAAVRATADELEGTVADDLWPLATYQEMLFIR